MRHNSVYLHIVAILFYIAVAILVTYPMVQNLTTHIIGDGNDNVEYYSYLHIARDHIREGSYPWTYTDVYRFPIGFNFALASDAKLFVFLGGLISNVVNITVTFNILVIAAFVANGFVSYLFFRHLTQSFHLGLIGGVMYGFSYYVLTRGAGHINLMQVYGFPLFGIPLVSIMRSGYVRYKDILLMGAGLFFIVEASLLYGAVFIGALFVAFPWLVYTFASQKQRPKLKGLFTSVPHTYLLVFVGIVCVGIYFTFPMVLPLKELGQELDLYKPVWFVSPITNIFSNEFYRPIMDTSALISLVTKEKIVFDIYQGYYLGTLELMLVVSYLVWILSSFRTHKRELAVALYAGCIWLLAHGGYFLDGTSGIMLIRDYFPFRLIPNLDRFFVVYYALFVSGILMFLKFYSTRLISLVILIIVLLERFSGSYWMTSLQSLGVGTRHMNFLRGIDGQGVLALPLDDFSSVKYNLIPFYADKKLVSGYFHRLGDGWPQRSLIESDAIRAFQCARNPSDGINSPIKNKEFPYDQYIGADIRTVVVYKKYLFYDNCYQVRRNILSTFGLIAFDDMDLGLQDFDAAINEFHRGDGPKHSRLIYEDEDVWVFRLVPISPDI